MLGRMIMVGFRGTKTTDPEVVRLVNLLQQGKLGGVILFDRDWSTAANGRNIRSVGQVRELTAHLKSQSALPLLVGVDQEGGLVRRLKPRHGFAEIPSAAYLGTQTVQEVEEIAASLGLALAELGINFNFAPVADVGVNPESPAIAKVDRAFSADPAAVARYAAAFARGQSRSGIISTYKHFPGHGSARTDTHDAFTDISATWMRSELIPYEAGRRPDVPLAIMTGHLYNATLDPDLPASLSSAVIDGLLRRELGWQGVVVSDDLQMKAITDRYGKKEAIRLAILAGTDIILSGNNLEYDPQEAVTIHRLMSELVAEGAISENRIRLSWERINRLLDSARISQNLPARQ